MDTTEARCDSWARRRLPVLIAAAAIAASGAITFPGAAPALSHSDGSEPPAWAGSGKTVSMPGNYFIYLSGMGTSYPLSGPNPVTYSLPNLKSAVLNDDFEGYIGITLGLDHAAAYTVTESGSQVTVDVAH